jgi:transcriptional regulator with XRE-family HTH domain
VTQRPEQSAIPMGMLTEDELNLNIGRRLRRRRRLRGLTQQNVSKELGLKFQQIQKYECAANRVSAARLFRLAVALQVPVQYFFEGLQPESHSGSPANDHGRVVSDEVLSSDEARDIMDVYSRLSPPVRRRLRDLAVALAQEPPRKISQATDP